ncbi:MAG: hypothetical protein ACE5G3_11110 [Gammaproteobacteria bacterium]
MVLFAASGMAVAGPPLFIDDPGILDRGQWEIITAATASKIDGGDRAVELPVLDVSVGLGENIQASAAYPYVLVDSGGGPEKSDFGNLAVGVKWRFFESETLQIAVAPGYQFGIHANAARFGIGSDTPVATLPVNLEYAWGDWILNAELAYAAIEREEDEVAYGAAIGHPVGPRMQLMLEIYGAASSEFEDHAVNFNVGADIAVTEAWHILVAAGSGISEPTGGEELRLTGFLGIQYFTGM